MPKAPCHAHRAASMQLLWFGSTNSPAEGSVSLESACAMGSVLGVGHWSIATSRISSTVDRLSLF